LLLASLCGCEQVTAQFIARHMKPRVTIDKIEYLLQASRDPRGATLLPIGVYDTNKDSSVIGIDPALHFPLTRLSRIWDTAVVYTTASQHEVDIIAGEVKRRCPIANMVALSGCELNISFVAKNAP
jgi:uncharacterized OsmC-like protein